MSPYCVHISVNESQGILYPSCFQSLSVFIRRISISQLSEWRWRGLQLYQPSGSNVFDVSTENKLLIYILFNLFPTPAYI